MSTTRDGLIRDLSSTASGGRRNPWKIDRPEYTVETGLISSTGQPWRRDFDQLLYFLRDSESDGPTIYLDTTTIWTGVELTKGNSRILAASTLMDLDKLTRSVILNDKIYYLPNQNVDPNYLNKLLGEEALVPLSPVTSSSGVGGVLSHLWRVAAPRVANIVGNSFSERVYADRPVADYEAEDSIRLFKDFMFFHDLEIETSGLRMGYDASKRIYSSTPWLMVSNILDSTSGRAVLQELAGRRHWRNWRERRADARSLAIIREETVENALEMIHRTTFHQLLCDAIGLVYDPSFVRFPAIPYFARNATQIALALADIRQLEELTVERLSGTARALGEVPPEILIPPYTAYILTKAGSLEEWWQISGDLRRKAKRYRRIRGEIQEALYLRDAKLLRSLKEELVLECSKKLDERLADGAKYGISSVAGVTKIIPGANSVFAGPVRDVVQSALKKPTVQAVRAIRRRLRPELRLFHDVGDVASNYLRGERKIRLLWQAPDIEARVSELAGYAERYKKMPSSP